MCQGDLWPSDPITNWRTTVSSVLRVVGMVKGVEEVVEGLRRPSNPARRERTIYGRRMKDAEGRNKEGGIWRNISDII